MQERWARLAGGPGAVCEACSQSRAKVEVRVDREAGPLEYQGHEAPGRRGREVSARGGSA